MTSRTNPPRGQPGHEYARTPYPPYVPVTPTPGPNEPYYSDESSKHAHMSPGNANTHYPSPYSGPGVLSGESTGVPEAPIDGTLYGRQDAAWMPIAGGGGGGVPEAPADGLPYARQNLAWNAITKAMAGLGNVDNTSDADKPISAATQAALDAKLTEAPADGYTYGRQSNAWVALEGVNGFMRKTGDTMTGNQTWQPPAYGVVLTLNKPVASESNTIFSTRGPYSQFNDWAIEMSGPTTHDFSIYRYDDSFVRYPALTINRATGVAKFGPGAAKTDYTATSSVLQLSKAGQGAGNYCALLGLMNGLLRWNMTMGDSGAETGTNAGSNFSIQRFNDAGNVLGTPLAINRASGNVALEGALQSALVFGGGTAAEMLISAASNYITGMPAWPATNGGLISIRANAAGNYSAGAITCYSGSGNTGVTLTNGATAWGIVSDERLKNIESEVTDGLDAVLVMRPIRYRYKTEEADAPLRVGLTAQSVQPRVPEAVSEVPSIGADGKVSTDMHLELRMAEVIPHLVGAIKTLHERIAALEAQLSPTP